MRVIRYVAAAWRSRWAYPLDALAGVAGDLLVAAVGLVLIGTIYGHVPDVRGWTRSEALVAWGMGQASLGAFQVLFGGLFAMNRQYLYEGELDRLLLRPLDPYAQVMLDHLAPQALGVTLAGVAVLLGAADVEWTALRVLALPVFVVSGALVVAGVLTALSAVGFWAPHQGSAVGLAAQLTSYGRYPLDFVPRPVAVGLLAVVPFAFTGFVPATTYMNRPEWWPLAALTPLAGLVVFAIGYGFWRFSLRRYASTGT